MWYDEAGRRYVYDPAQQQYVDDAGQPYVYSAADDNYAEYAQYGTAEEAAPYHYDAAEADPLDRCGAARGGVARPAWVQRGPAATPLTLRPPCRLPPCLAPAAMTSCRAGGRRRLWSCAGAAARRRASAAARWWQVRRRGAAGGPRVAPGEQAQSLPAGAALPPSPRRTPLAAADARPGVALYTFTAENEDEVRGGGAGRAHT